MERTGHDSCVGMAMEDGRRLEKGIKVRRPLWIAVQGGQPSMEQRGSTLCDCEQSSRARCEGAADYRGALEGAVAQGDSGRGPAAV